MWKFSGKALNKLGGTSRLVVPGALEEKSVDTVPLCAAHTGVLESY